MTDKSTSSGKCLTSIKWLLKEDKSIFNNSEKFTLVKSTALNWQTIRIF